LFGALFEPIADLKGLKFACFVICICTGLVDCRSDVSPDSDGKSGYESDYCSDFFRPRVEKSKNKNSKARSALISLRILNLGMQITHHEITHHEKIYLHPTHDLMDVCSNKSGSRLSRDLPTQFRLGHNVKVGQMTLT
jgi:hypothetical protein